MRPSHTHQAMRTKIIASFCAFNGADHGGCVYRVLDLPLRINAEHL
jgi:hypothetical protein